MKYVLSTDWTFRLLRDPGAEPKPEVPGQAPAPEDVDDEAGYILDDGF